MDVDADAEEGNFATFRDCLLESIVNRLAPVTEQHGKRQTKQRKQHGGLQSSIPSKDIPTNSGPSGLPDFSDFIASEIFQTLNPDLKSLSHQALQDDPDLAENWSLPLSLTVFEEIAEHTDPSVSDSLTAYGVIEPPKSDLQSFLSPVITSYISAVTVPPPKWIATRASECEICDRGWVPLTYHHLIPREVHAKVLKRGWHDEHMLNSVAWLCRACHSFVHKMASNEELAREWFTVERICEREDVQKWAVWVGRVRWKKT